MAKEKAQLLLGLTLLGGFSFIYCLDLILGMREGLSRGNWMPCFLVVLCTLYAGLQWKYLDMKKKEEEMRKKPPTLRRRQEEQASQELQDL